MLDKEFKRLPRFDRLAKEQDLEKELPKLPKYSVRYIPPAGLVPNDPFKWGDFRSEADRKKWYEETGKAIEKTHGGKMEFYEEKE